ncbi:glycoside hydrolase family 78 protein [Favolaschia claudopus]|uniref:Glycoside hydrolase family 78 protein n=1 Tax=Favolaschia claudopus TaxID=2862362 RepID=A0AAW0CFH7_9AGAR
MLRALSFAICTATLSAALAPPGPWDSFNYAPDSKIVKPVTVRTVSGTVQGANGLVENSEAQATFSGDGSYVVLDWGKEVGGILSLTIDSADPSSQFSLSFTESPLFISPFKSDDSVNVIYTQDADGVQTFGPSLQTGLLRQTIGQQRPGFRYSTIVSNNDAPLTISNISLEITFMPHRDNLRAYGGYFYAPDPGFHDEDFLTKLWYAGAYTVQTNTIDSQQARRNGNKGWSNDASGGPVNGPILVDGAKRDRNVWPGDCGIASHTEFVALDDLLPTKNALTVMFTTQDSNSGELGYSGPPNNARGSDTYNAWSLIGTHNYYLYTGDLDFVKFVWANYTKAVAFLESQVDSTGLANVPQGLANDWGRDGGAGHNSVFNALLYRTLVTASDLATQLGDTALASGYLTNATLLKRAYNALLWDESAGMFRDNDSPDSHHPQDGNSVAVLFNLTTSASQNEQISEGLTQYWTPIGPLSPELADTIIPFIGGFEVQAHFIAAQGERAIDLLEKEWGYMLYTNISVESTLLEGFTANGSLGYRAASGYDFDHSYTSHAHGWSTGPTPALTFHVLGIQLSTAQGATWRIAPVLSGLPSAEGGLTTGLGFFSVKWASESGTLTLTVDTPEGTKGVVRVPGHGSITVDDVVQDTQGDEVELSGGKHIITRSV